MNWEPPYVQCIDRKCSSCMILEAWDYSTRAYYKLPKNQTGIALELEANRILIQAGFQTPLTVALGK